MSEIFKKGKRHFRKTLRGRSDEQDSSSSTSSSTPSVTTPPDKKSPPTLLSYPAPVPSAGGGGVVIRGAGGEGNTKERVQQWIQQQAAGFLDKWVGPATNNPAHQVVASLKEAAAGLDPKSPTCLTSLNVCTWHVICMCGTCGISGGVMILKVLRSGVNFAPYFF